MDEPMTRVEALYREHGPAILNYLRRRCADGGWAEDLLHETFARALRQVDRLDEVRSPKAWLLGIARNVWRGARRGRRRTRSLPHDLAAESPARDDPRLEQMRRALDALPDAFREVLELRLREELSYEEIANVLGIPVGTVRSRLHHAVRRLQEMMSRDHDV